MVANPQATEYTSERVGASSTVVAMSHGVYVIDTEQCAPTLGCWKRLRQQDVYYALYRCVLSVLFSNHVLLVHTIISTGGYSIRQ